MATVCTVNGTDRTSRVKRGSVSIQKVASGQDTFSCVFVSKSAGSIYRPLEGQELTYSIEGSLPCGFGGTIVSVEETAVQDPDVAWACRVDAVNFTEWLNLIMVDDVWGTSDGIYDRAHYYWTNFIQPRFGGTYGGPTTGGEILAAATYELMYLRDVMDEMVSMAGMFYNVGGDKLFALGIPGAIAGPVTLSQNNSGLVAQGSAQSITRQKKRLTWFTRGYMKVSAPEGTAQDAPHTITNEVHTANGIASEWPLKNRPVVVAPTQIKINGGSTVTLPSGGYSYDASKKSIVKSSTVPTAGTTITILSYQSKYPTTVVYDDQQTQIRETILDDAAPGTTLAQAYDIAAYFVQNSAEDPPTMAIVNTRTNGFYIGMSAALSFSNRNVNGTYWVTEIGIRDIANAKPNSTHKHRYTLTCVEGTGAYVPWQRKLRNRLSGGGGGGRSSIQSGTVTPTTASGLVGSYPLHTNRSTGIRAASYTAIGNGIYLNSAAVPPGATVKFRALIRTENAGTSVTAKLVRLTGAGAPVDVATTSASTSTSWVSQEITFVPIAGWQSYELQVIGSNGTNAVFALGAVDVLT